MSKDRFDDDADYLQVLWGQAEEALFRHRCYSNVIVSKDDLQIGYVKVPGSKGRRICVMRKWADGGDWFGLGPSAPSSASAVERINCVKLYPALREAVIKQAEWYENRLPLAVDEMQHYLDDSPDRVMRPLAS